MPTILGILTLAELGTMTSSYRRSLEGTPRLMRFILTTCLTEIRGFFSNMIEKVLQRALAGGYYYGGWHRGFVGELRNPSWVGEERRL